MYIAAVMVRAIRLQLPTWRTFASVVLLGASLAGMLSAARAQGPEADPEEDHPASASAVSVLVSAGTDTGGVRITLTFSRQVDYRLEEARSRLRVLLPEPLAESSALDRDLDSEVVRRIRVEPSSRTSQVVFNLGRDFDHFSSAELSDPFRLVLDFRGARGPSAPGSETGSTIEGESAPRTAGAAPGEGSAGEEAGRERAGETAGLTAAPEGAPIAVLDPGHGGEETGAVGDGGLQEKDLVLDIARRLRTRLSAAGFAVALTRDEDAPKDLTSRTALANGLGASVFVSIHANASSRASARGAETYFLAGDAADEAAAGLARGEEAGSAAGDPRSDRTAIEAVLWEMAQVEHLSRSSRLAELVQDALDALDSSGDRGVKQAPFRVLVGAAMPAILVEVGFLSNPEEEVRLGTEAHRERIAELIADALSRFVREEGILAGPRPDFPIESRP